MTPSASFTDQHILYYPEAPFLYRRGQMLDAIPRIEFDNALWRATVAAGAKTLEGASVTGLIVEDGWVRGIKLRDGDLSRELTCGLVVGADGSRSIVRRETGTTDDDYIIHSLRQYVRGIPETSRGFVFSFDTENLGYFWIFPFIRNGERWANVGYGNATNNQILKERFHQFCQTAEMQRYLGDGRFQGNLAGFPLNLARFRWNGRLTRRLWGPGYLLLGDAAALIHPLTGEGISFAMESGRIAAQVLADETISTQRKGAVYERRVLRRVRPVFLSVTAFCAIRLPSLLPRILSRALVSSVAFAQRHFGFAVGPMEPVQNIVTFEVVLLFVLISAFGAFWAVQLWSSSALPVAYGTRAAPVRGYHHGVLPARRSTIVRLAIFDDVPDLFGGFLVRHRVDRNVHRECFWRLSLCGEHAGPAVWPGACRGAGELVHHFLPFVRHDSRSPR